MSTLRFLASILLLLVPASGGAQAPAFELAWGSHGLLGPSDVTVLDDGGVIVLERFNDFVLRLSPQGTYIESRYLRPDTHACPLDLWALARTSGDHVFVNLYRYGQVLRLNENLETVATWSGFGRPTGIAINARDEVFVSDSERHIVQKFDSTGTLLVTWGSLGNEPGQFDEPCGVAVDPIGLVYVVDRNNHRIQAFDFSGKFRFAWGSEGGGPGQFGHFTLPCGIDVGPDGSIYVGDTGNHRVQKFSRPVGVSESSWDRVKTLFC